MAPRTPWRSLVMIRLTGYNFALRMDSETLTLLSFSLHVCMRQSNSWLVGFKKDSPVFWWLIYARVQEIIEHLKKANTEIRDWVRMDTFCLSEFTSATPTYSNLMLPSYSGTPWRIILCWLLLVRNRCQPDVPHDRNGWWDLFKYRYVYSNRWNVLDLILSCGLLLRDSWPMIHVKGDHPSLCSQHGIPIRLLLSTSLEWRKIFFYSDESTAQGLI